MIDPADGTGSGQAGGGVDAGAPRAAAERDGGGGAAEAPRSDEPAFRYTPKLAGQIETRWQEVWDRSGVFAQPNPGESGFDPSRPKFYCLDMFPYPSAAGLHVGHPEGYTATDIISRYKRMRGFNVLHPMGWDAFGLPAEQYAIQTGIHPAVTTREAINNFRRQLRRFGFSYDWSREFGTIDEDYYGFTQWIFLRLYHSWFDLEAGSSVDTEDGEALPRGRGRPIDELVAELEQGTRPVRINPDASEHTDEEKLQDLGPWSALDEPARHRVVNSYRLAYIGEQTVNWCPKLGTALANEEVIDGRSERGGFPVFRKPLRQWMLRITAYAGRLLDDLAGLEWPESTKVQQAEWIGRSTGSEIRFELENPPAGAERELLVYTTRPDTLFGATYMVVAPEHPLVAAVLADPPEGCDREQVAQYVQAARNRSDVERQESRQKTGVFLGVMARNPGSGEAIPVWAADYVLWGYGSGAIMAVPAHDQRDYEFARAFELPVSDVVLSMTEWAMTHFAHNATDHERADPELWKIVLADLLGLANSADRPRPADLPGLLALVRSRRTGALAPPEARADHGIPPRGAVALEWREAIDAMGFSSFDALYTTVVTASFSGAAGRAYAGAGYLANSANDSVSLNGLPVPEAKRVITHWLEKHGRGRRKVNYRLRDWLFSRQRYWGEPFPIIFGEDGRHWAVSTDALPVRLPEMSDYQPAESADPQPLLAKAAHWVVTTAGAARPESPWAGAARPDDAAVMRRETNTMPGWAGSCWYYLRYCDPRNADRFVGRPAERYWMLSAVRGADATAAEQAGTFEPHLHRLGGVDLYVGGAEHAVLHLLYARFWHKVLFDLGEVSTPEPFHKLFHQGLITSHAFQAEIDGQKKLVPVDEIVRVVELPDGVEFRDGFDAPIDPPPDHERPGTDAGEPRWHDTREGHRSFAYHRPSLRHAWPVIAKMSKSLKNVVNPDEVIESFGADTFRLYEMYMGPLEQSKPWNTDDTIGMFRFLRDLWRLCIDETTGSLRAAEPQHGTPAAADEQVERLLHRTIARVGDGIERLSFNTAIAAMIEFKNACQAAEKRLARPALTRDQLERLARVLSPFAPHMAEELWCRLGHVALSVPRATDSVSRQPWPSHDPAMLRDDSVEIPVQILGKVRARIVVPADADEKACEAAALADPRIVELLEGKAIRKVIVVAGRMVNIVTG